MDPARKIRVGNKLYFGESDMVAEVIDNTTSRGRTIKFLFDGPDEDFYKALYDLGETPLPREIITREADAQDKERYQTIYAKHIGAVAAPSAGLHFTREVLKRLEIKGIETTAVTLHVRPGHVPAGGRGGLDQAQDGLGELHRDPGGRRSREQVARRQEARVLGGHHHDAGRWSRRCRPTTT